MRRRGLVLGPVLAVSACTGVALATTPQGSTTTSKTSSTTFPDTLPPPLPPTTTTEATTSTTIAPAPTTTTTTTMKPVITGSVGLGRPERGSLVRGLLFPEQSVFHSTWDPGLKTTPSRSWRRYSNDYVVATVLCVLQGYRSAHPDATRVLVGDMSLQNGGVFGRDYGGKGHESHQNGLDVDVYYPRRDGKETAPLGVSDIDVARSQELVDRFVAAGAITIYVGPRTQMRGPKKIVTFARNHDDHLHVRFGNRRGTPWTSMSPVCGPQ